MEVGPEVPVHARRAVVGFLMMPNPRCGRRALGTGFPKTPGMRTPAPPLARICSGRLAHSEGLQRADE